MRRKDMAGRLSEIASKSGEPILKQSLLELCADRRILIENHRGIVGYSDSSINIKVKFGSISIDGSCLEICRMTSDQLVITGNIETITLSKGRSS